MKTFNHPCFNSAHAATHGRIHLPVAKKCNIQCGYCNRLYDCVNESRPGVTSAVLSPDQAVVYLKRIMPPDKSITVIGIAGPGDPFAEPEKTLETLSKVKEEFPTIELCVSTNGLTVAEYVDDLVNIGVNFVTITVNAIDPAIQAKIISWARFKSKMYRGLDAANILISQQLKAIKELKSKGVTVKINTIVLPGINDNHIEEVAKTVAALGADVHNCIPFLPVEDSTFESLERPDHDTMQKARWQAGQYMQVVKHCARCRSDAVGLLGQSNPDHIAEILKEITMGPMNPNESRPYVAITSKEGVLINEHLGKSERFYIFEKNDSDYNLVAIRDAPKLEAGENRWETLAKLLEDCQAIVTYQVGGPPQYYLEKAGIKVYTSEGMIEYALDAIYSGKDPQKAFPVRHCTGPMNGGGCG